MFLENFLENEAFLRVKNNSDASRTFLQHAKILVLAQSF